MSVKWLKGFGHESLILRQFSQDSWPNTRKRRIIICRSRLSGLLPCVASWKPVLFAHFLNAELLGAIASYIEQSSKLKQEIKARNQAWCDMLSVCVCVFHFCIPIKSAKPPTGRRQVPVTNCSSLILFSLSISFTNCQHIFLLIFFNKTTMTQNINIIFKISTCSVQLDYNCQGALGMHVNTNLPKPENLLATSGIMSVDCVSLPVH